jgi:serine/threonine-protein kinase
LALNPGTRLGPYEITAPLGVGGMGEVYRATDTNLKRQVAIKVLPASVAGDAERLARFQREAEVLAALNHPNIAHIHGLEKSDGTVALVMELVEGPTLAERIAKGALPVDEALPIAKQIAEALEAAHGQGIIHRDLKPANIKVRADGSVKVLDFGLAKAIERTGDASLLSDGTGWDGTHLPTITSPAATAFGVILGTAAYMSPEQARGKPVDRRTDIWAFGCVLYEMLTGQRPFDGDEISDVLASVLKTEPDWQALPTDTPLVLRKLIKRCLAKDRHTRVPDISVARFEVADLIANPVDAGIPQVSPVAGDHRRAPSWTLATVAAVLSAAASGLVIWFATRPPQLPVLRLSIQHPDGTPMGTRTGGADIAISPDGLSVAYMLGSGGSTGGSTQLFVRSLRQLTPVTLTGIGDTVAAPFFSPDGNWVGYLSRGSVRKVPAAGGASIEICRIQQGTIRGAAWGDDNWIYFTDGIMRDGIRRVSANGGTPEVVTRPDETRGEIQYELPEPLPHGRGLLYTTLTTLGTVTADNSAISVFDAESKTSRVLVHGGSNPRYSSTGYIVFAAQGHLRAIRFNLANLTVSGDAVPIVENVLTKSSTGAADFSIAANGTLAYVNGDSGGSRELFWVDRTTHEEQRIPVAPRAFTYPRISPDGTRIALDIRDQDNDTWVLELTGNRMRRLTSDPGANRGVAWSRDGKRIAFSVADAHSEGIYWQAADGSGQRERLTSGENAPDVPIMFAPDGYLVFNEPGGPPYHTLRVKLEGEHSIEPLLNDPNVSEAFGEVSPDGHWLAYQSNESGEYEIYVRPYPDAHGPQTVISSGGGTRPLWAHSGKELFYLQTAGRLFSVAVETGEKFSAQTPKLVLDGPYLAPQDGRPYDIDPADRRFVMIKDEGAKPGRPISQLILVPNWFEELKRLVPTK